MCLDVKLFVVTSHCWTVSLLLSFSKQVTATFHGHVQPYYRANCTVFKCLVHSIYSIRCKEYLTKTPACLWRKLFHEVAWLLFCCI